MDILLCNVLGAVCRGSQMRLPLPLLLLLLRESALWSRVNDDRAYVTCNHLQLSGAYLGRQLGILGVLCF
jgi:hypothetical protein